MSEASAQPVDPQNESKLTPAIDRRKIGLCLGGGGVTGAMYEVGCLAALEEFFEDFSAADFNVIVGSSSGAVVGLALAGRFTANRLYRALLDPADDFFPLRRNHLLRLDATEWKRVAASVVGAVRHLFSSAAARPLDLDLWEEVDRFWDSLPAGIFTLDEFERFILGFMSRRNIAEEFSELDTRLLLVAYDLDRGERVVFGAEEEQSSIARAICASTALPLLFAPVRIGERDFIDGGLGEMAHADLAADAGCELLLVINPMVPIRTNLRDKEVPTGHGRRHRVRDKGMIWVNSQAWRLRAESRLQRGLARFTTEHPETPVLLLEPDPDDATMFMYSPMNFAARRTILEDGFKSTLLQLRDETSELRIKLLAAGLRPKHNT